jgi:hypothetical protein
VLVLNHENETLDKKAVEYLDYFMDRKTAKKALILYSDPDTRAWLKKVKLSDHKVVKYMEKQRADLLYDYYSFDKFFDNIVFTWTSKPAENLLGRVLAETDVNETDAVCLALYHLRSIPGQGEIHV